jgi:hypothetical protein
MNYLSFVGTFTTFPDYPFLGVVPSPTQPVEDVLVTGNAGNTIQIEGSTE